MQKAILQILKTLKSGELSINLKDSETVRLNIENRRIIINLVNVQTLLSLLDLIGKSGDTPSILESIKNLRNLAEDLKKEKLTVNIQLSNKPFLILGKEANPKISQILTGSNAIELQSLTSLLKIVKTRTNIN